MKKLILLLFLLLTTMVVFNSCSNDEIKESDSQKSFVDPSRKVFANELDLADYIKSNPHTPVQDSIFVEKDIIESFKQLDVALLC